MAEGGGATLLLCLAAGSGLPLFCRPPRPQPPFPLIGALNGVHMFGAGAGVGLRRAETPGTHLQWGGDGSSITLIALSSAPDASGPALKRLLDSAFGAMVLVLGLDELVPIRNVERLKRDLRSCFVLLDALLTPGGGLGLGPPSWPLPPGPPRDILQDTLDAFSAAAGSRWGCLLGAGRARAATRRWGALPAAERALLAALLGGGAAAPPAAARDLPVYLPHSSPTVPHRLLVLGLGGGVGVALLCGPRPPLQHVITQLVPRFWGPVSEQLRGCGRGPPAPPPRGVLAYLLIHHQQGWTQSSVSRGGARAGVLPPQHRGAALRHLYALMAPKYCPEEGAPPPGPPPALCYVSLPTHTGLVVVGPGVVLVLLLPPRAPRQRLRPLGLSCLRALTRGCDPQV